jgi:hypothetical protein
MTLDRWRGQLGFVGYLVRKWDIWQLRRFERKLRQHGRKYEHY